MKYKLLSTIALSALLCTSCQDWLDVKPEGSPSQDSFWKTDADFTTATYTIYENMSLEETWGRDLFWEQGASDDIFFSRSRGNSQMNLANLDMDGSTEGSIKDIYSAMYETNAASNNIVYRALMLPSRSDVINYRLGEAYFMRAFTHFMIAYRYGRVDNGVPFDRYEDYEPYPEQYKIPEQRESVVDNYRLIIEDLDAAAALLPWFKDTKSDDYGRATKDAALALKVKTLAYWAQHDPAKWTDVPALVDRLESEGARGLLDDFSKVFRTENEWSKEYIWSVNSSGEMKAGSVFPGIMLDNKGWGRYNGWGNFKPTLELWAEYDEDDMRRPATIMQYGDEFKFFGENRKFYSSADLECGFHFRKYMEPFEHGTVSTTGAGISSTVSSNGNRPTTDLNVPIIRFAEMLLFKAEALIEMGKDGSEPLNRIAERAGMGRPYANPSITDLMHERRCELAGEYTDRVMDLKRWIAKYPEVKSVLEAPKHGLKYTDRSNPESELYPNGSHDLDGDGNVDIVVEQKVINGKTYNGVIRIMEGKSYDASKDCVLPYSVNEVIQAQGALKQNPGYPSN